MGTLFLIKMAAPGKASGMSYTREAANLLVSCSAVKDTESRYVLVYCAILIQIWKKIVSSNCEVNSNMLKLWSCSMFMSIVLASYRFG